MPDCILHAMNKASATAREPVKNAEEKKETHVKMLCQAGTVSVK